MAAGDTTAYCLFYPQLRLVLLGHAPRLAGLAQASVDPGGLVAPVDTVGKLFLLRAPLDSRPAFLHASDSPALPGRPGGAHRPPARQASAHLRPMQSKPQKAKALERAGLNCRAAFAY